MNTKQRIVLLIGALLFVALGIFVPWHSAGSAAPLMHYGDTVPNAPERFDTSLGYSLIFMPPQPSSIIDIRRLAVEWLSLLALTGGLIAVLGKNRVTGRSVL